MMMVPGIIAQTQTLKEGAMRMTITNELPTLIGIVVGFFPYIVKKQRMQDGYELTIRALFWSVQYTAGQGWIVCVPLIGRFQQAIWSVISHLRDDHFQL